MAGQRSVDLPPKAREPRYRSRAAAEMLGVSHWFLCQEVRAGRLEATHIANRYEITGAAIDAYLAARAMPTQQAA